MQISEHSFSGRNDLDAMADLVHKFPTENLHVVDLPYRFSSSSFDYPEASYGLHRQILNWADEHAQKIVNTPSGHPAWFVTALASQIDRIRDLEQAGFESQADVGDNSWSQVLMAHSMQIPDDIHLPDGFHIRPLNDVSEVEAYVELHRAVFESKNMTIEWRRRTLQRPEYISDLDLIAVAPNGQLAAFCVCWLAKDSNGEVSGQIEPLGVHADFRKLGLGRGILVEGLKRLSAKGTKHTYVQTDSYRDAAFKLYESAGFHVMHDILIYRKNYE